MNDMFRGSVPLGKWFGIPVRLHYTWFFIFAVVTYVLAASYFPTVYPAWGMSLRIFAGLFTSLLFFASVLGHELMHCVVAKQEGIPIESITLFALGGVSQMTEEPKTPADEFRMAIAGPASSLVIGGIFWGIYFLTRNNSSMNAQIVTAVSYWLGYINLTLGIFNLIPGFPLDGGRVLRSSLWRMNGSLQRATKVAANIGRGVGFIFIVGGIGLIFTTYWFNGIWFALIGWFLESSAVGSYRQVLMQDMLKGHVAKEVMSQNYLVVPPDITLEQLVNENILTTGRRSFPVVGESGVLGLITLHNVRTVPREQWRIKTVREAMTPLNVLKSVHPDDDLSSVLQILLENDINQVPVVADHSVVGMIARDSVLSFVDVRTQLKV
jgi:Zn-dependent protease/CBS domain-containing protein